MTRSPIAALFAALLLAVPAFAGTFPVSTAPLGEPPETRSVPELTAGREGYLATWTDARSGATVLLAARVAPDGSVLDPTGIVLAPMPSSAAVIWNGASYLVFFPYGADLAVRAVAEDGSVGAIRTVVPNALVDLQEPIEAATNGQRIVIAYAGDHPSWDVRARVHAAVLAMDGTLLNDVLLDETRADYLEPSVAANGSGFAVAWNRSVFTPAQELEGFALHAVRFDDRGVRIDAQARKIGGTGAEASLRPNGETFVANRPWESWFVSADLAVAGTPENRPPGRFFTLRGAAAVIDEEVVELSGAEIPRWVQVATYDEQGRPGMSRRVLQGTPDGREAIAGASAVQRGDDVLIAWLTYSSQDNSPIRMYTRLASADTLAPRSERRVLTRSAAPQRAPSFVAGETEALAAWKQLDGIYAARVTSDGRPLDGPGIRLSEGVLSHPPAAAYHGGRYAVAFGQPVSDQQWEVVVRFISPAGGLLPETIRIPVARWMGHVALASGGGSLVLVWTDEGQPLRATRIYAGGTYDPPVAVVEAGGLLEDPVISFNGTHFLLAWTDVYLDWDILYRTGILARRMTPELQFADTEPRTLVSFGWTRNVAEPSLASNGSAWFLTWTSTANAQTQQVRAARIAADGTAEDSRALTHGFGAEIAWTGTQLVVAWKDDALYVAPLTEVLGAPRILDPSPMVYEDRQVSLTRWGSSWAAAYPLVGGVEVGHVPRVVVTVEGRSARKVRAIR
ncbi:MAG TPA: hypothetical protein VF432_14525 [Thermoanaerobaculia bacterium]